MDLFWYQFSILLFASVLNLGLSFLFSLVETSLMITDDITFQSIIKKQTNEKKKKLLKKIFQRRDKHGAALSVAITLTNVTGSSMLGSMAAQFLNSTYVIIFTILITYFMLVFARTIPKIYARRVNQKTLIKYALLIRIIYFLSIPILWFTLIWVKIFKLQNTKKKLTISELKDIVSIYKKNGIIQNTEEMIFGKLMDVREANMGALFKKERIIERLEENKKISFYVDTLINSKNKKLYVVNDKNKITGIVNHKDLVLSLLRKEDLIIKDFSKKIKFVNHNDLIIEVISKLDQKTVNVIVLDEDSKPMGISSIKDLYFYMTGKKNKKEKDLSN